jgi:hypothetical protein
MAVPSCRALSTRRYFWSMALLRQEVEQAERDRSNKLVRLMSSIAATRRQLQARADRG